MSVLGFVSPSNANPCGNCGNEAGGNVLHLSATGFTKTPAHVLVSGSMWSDDGSDDVYVCDVCLWSALRTTFGHLLKET